MAILYAALLGIIYREMHVKDMVQGLKETVCSTASIMLIVSAASVFSWILTKERIPQTLTAWMLANIHSKFVFPIVVNVFLLLVGMFIEGNASMIILVPLLAPIAAEYGINEIQFAMIYIFNNAIGALSPPMGTLMFVTCSITKCKTAAFIKEAVPFYILLVVNPMLPDMVRAVHHLPGKSVLLIKSPASKWRWLHLPDGWSCIHPADFLKSRGKLYGTFKL